MVKHALWLTLLISACYDDRYRCDEHTDCDLGEGGRCEANKYCTYHDTNCDTLRRYAPHAGELSGQCFDDRVEPINACAGGQPPARDEGACYSAVCRKLDTCCKVAWLDACVQIAQEIEDCKLRCDTRLAITASRGNTTERWDVRWSNNSWSHIEPRHELTAFGWVAPAPGEPQPRLVGVVDDALLIGGAEPIMLPPGRAYRAITSIPFDRDGRDTVVAAYNGPEGNRLEIWKLDTQTPVAREHVVPGITALSWGEADRDTYPDAIAGNGADRFVFLYNVKDETYERRLLNQSGTGAMAGFGTPGSQQVSSFDWMDLNSDGELDLLIFGNELRLHQNALGLGNPAARQIDCNPPHAMRSCSMDVNEPNLEAAAFAGCGVPTASGPFVVMSMFPGRKMFRVAPDGTVQELGFDTIPCSCMPIMRDPMKCPGPMCDITGYNCNSCPSVIAMVARDLDHDRSLDLIAIDARLNLYVAKAKNGYAWGGPTPIAGSTFQTLNQGALLADVSVTGALE